MKPTLQWYRKQAKKKHEREGEVEFDHEPVVSRDPDAHGDRGAYVQAWIWIEDPPEENQQ